MLPHDSEEAKEADPQATAHDDCENVIENQVASHRGDRIPLLYILNPHTLLKWLQIADDAL